MTGVLIVIVWIVVGTIAAMETPDGYRAFALFLLWPAVLAWGLINWLVRSTIRVVYAVPALFRDASSW